MAQGVNEKAVLSILRSRVAPMTYPVLLQQFSGNRREIGNKLRSVLFQAMSAGTVKYCKDHYYAATHADDVVKYMQNFPETKSNNGSKESVDLHSRSTPHHEIFSLMDDELSQSSNSDGSITYDDNE